MRGVHCARAARASCGSWIGRGVGLALLWIAAPSYAQDGDRSCTAWPGEISPLPTVSDPDPFAARWASLRSAELARLAAAVEAEDPAEAYRIWIHLECMDPESNASARAEALQPGFVIAQRPQPRVPDEPQRTVARERPPVAAPPPPAIDFGPFDERIAGAEDSLLRARFRDVLQTTDELRSQLEGWPPGSGVRERRARLEVLGASALIALGLPGRAAESFARALEADPGLTLDPATTPPKVRSLLEEVRERRGSQP